MCMPQYSKDYAEIGGRPPAPIRWLPWESILLVRYWTSIVFVTTENFILKFKLKNYKFVYPILKVYLLL